MIGSHQPFENWKGSWILVKTTTKDLSSAEMREGSIPKNEKMPYMVGAKNIEGSHREDSGNHSSMKQRVVAHGKPCLALFLESRFKSGVAESYEEEFKKSKEMA